MPPPEGSPRVPVSGASPGVRVACPSPVMGASPPLCQGEAHGALPWWRTASVLLHAPPLQVAEGPKTAPSAVFSCAQRFVVCRACSAAWG